IFQLKGYKVTDVSRTRKFGVACRSLQELKRKACAKLNHVQLYRTSRATDKEQPQCQGRPSAGPSAAPANRLTAHADLPLFQLSSSRSSVGKLAYTKRDSEKNTSIAAAPCSSYFPPVTNDLAEVNVFLLDGSLIDEEYFSTLEPQVTLILAKPGEKILSDADLFYDTLRRVNIDFLTAGDKASEFLTENLKAKVAVLNNALNKDDSKTVLSDRDEHPEWFRGLDTNYTTKEAYMHRRCQDRIRGYLYKTIDQIKSSDTFSKDPRARKQLLYAIAFFKMQLKEDHYLGHYFDRSRTKIEAETLVALCDRKGEFRCNGVWNADKCAYGERHRINPYRSREELILFSTWNFDHKIERSRTLIPLLLNLSSQGIANETDIFEIYENLFTVKNLRLVHIVCHDKGSHK
ncbi:DNA fragmentation factor subunit beta, partial [Habropoda laboriosa]